MGSLNDQARMCCDGKVTIGAPDRATHGVAPTGMSFASPMQRMSKQGYFSAVVEDEPSNAVCCWVVRVVSQSETDDSTSGRMYWVASRM